MMVVMVMMHTTTTTHDPLIDATGPMMTSPTMIVIAQVLLGAFFSGGALGGL